MRYAGCCGFQYSVDHVAILSFGLCPGGRLPTPFARERYLQDTYVTNSVQNAICAGGVSALRLSDLSRGPWSETY